MAVLKLPRMPDGAAIVNTQNGKPITALTRAWNSAMTQIETSVTDIEAAIAAADAAQSDADAAMAAAIAAQADADAAMAAAVAAQATADDAKATADALDAALNVTAGKVLTVLNTMTLAAIDGSTLNIGAGGTLGTAAYTNASDYLPSGSSGAFLAKANNLSDVASVPTARSNLGVTATGADVTYAFRGNNLSDLGSIPTARTNLGITATGADAAYAFRANNLSDLASAPAARTNLGLGTAATQNTGTSGANVPLLNGANTWSATQIYGSNVFVGGTAQITTESFQVTQTTALTTGVYFANSNAAPGSAAVQRIGFTGSSPNNATAIHLICTDNVGVRSYLASNGGLAHVIANDISLSDANVKGAVQRYSETDLDALERSFLKVNWGRFKYLDQTHDDWNHGYTAQGIEEAFALTAPELVDETELGTKAGSGETRKGVYDADLTHIGLALLARGLKRIEAMEGKMYAAGIT